MKTIPNYYLVRDQGKWFYQTPFGRVQCPTLEEGIYQLIK